MINISNLQNKIIPNDILGVFGITLSENLVKNGYVITKNPNFNHLFMLNPEGKLVSIDNPYYILGYATKLLDVEFNSILVGGLGLGLIPYVCQDFAQVDVIENDQNIIDITSQLNHLGENVNIINGDIFTFEPTKTYDIIVMDIWYNSIPEDITENIISKYLPCLNEEGFLYLPLNQYDNPTKVKIN
jgi:protein-L-isoaspartate O-methyltransferase